MNATADGHMARVLSSWSISTKVVQPLFIAAGGVVATVASPRFALTAFGLLLLTDTALLPWRSYGAPAI